MNVVARPRLRFLARFLGLTVALAATGGCVRAHLTDSHGRAYHEAFAIQDANPNRKGAPKSVNGLDSQEASIIAGSYRKALAPKADVSQSSGQLLMMSPNRGGSLEAGAMAPSVPQGN
jgi:hypothetical protein